MDLFLLDSTFHQEDVVEGFKSLIWTDRMTSYGDFELVLSADSPTINKLNLESFLTASVSDSIMFLESIVKDAESNTIKCTGRSLESIFLDRVDASVFNTAPYTTQTVAQRMGTLVTTGYQGNTDDIISNLRVGSQAVGTPTISIPTSKTDVVTVYDRLKALGEEFDVGWRMTFEHNNPTWGQDVLVFETYTGVNRTRVQSVNPWVVFDSSLGNLKDVSYVQSDVNYKNVAYVIDEWTDSSGIAQHFRVVNRFDLPPQFATKGLGRRVLIVPSTGVNKADYSESNWIQVCNRLGKAELAKHNRVNILDGTIIDTGEFLFNRDFFLGDVVNIGLDQATRQEVRITEHIWSLDETGLHSYPTFKSTV